MSRTSVTRTIRDRKARKAGTRRKAKNRTSGTTPKFSIHEGKSKK